MTDIEFGLNAPVLMKGRPRGIARGEIRLNLNRKRGYLDLELRYGDLAGRLWLIREKSLHEPEAGASKEGVNSDILVLYHELLNIVGNRVERGAFEINVGAVPHISECQHIAHYERAEDANDPGGRASFGW